MIQTWQRWAREFKIQVYAVYLAYRDPRVPWYARVFAACVVAYAFSPIDLIPDFIPILGYLDDLILIPLGVAVVIKLIPAEVWAEYRQASRQTLAQGKPVNQTAAIIIVIIWLAVALIAGRFVLGMIRP